MSRPRSLASSGALCTSAAAASHPALADPPATAASSATLPSAIDETASELLKKVQITMIGLKTYQAECNTTTTRPSTKDKDPPAQEIRESATLLAVKPNKMRYEHQVWECDAKTGQWQPSGKPGITFVCDGKTNWRQFGASYRKSDETKPHFQHTLQEPWDGFYFVESSPYATVSYSRQCRGLLELRYDGSENVNGIPCEKVFAHTTARYRRTKHEYWTTWYIGNDGIVRRKVERIELNGKPGYTRDAILKDIRVDQPTPADPAVFTYVAPKGVAPKGVESEEQRQREQPPLLAKGTAAPAFTATDLE